MYWAREAAGPWLYIYFTSLIFVSFFLLNLIVVIIIVNYSLSQVSVICMSCYQYFGHQIIILKPHFPCMTFVAFRSL